MKQLLSALAALGITILAYGGVDNLKKAERLYKAGMYTEAAVLLESEKGDEAEAYKALCALAQGTDAALVRAESFMGRFPESLLLPQVRFRTANYLFGKEKYEDALKHYFRISASSLSEDEQTEFLYKKGYSALKSSDLERARTFLDQCQRRERSDYTAPAQYALGYLAYSRGRFREASGWFEEAKIDPRFSPVEPGELSQLEISVDVLSPPEKISSTEELDVKRYGVIVSRKGKRGLLLPDLDGVDTVEQQVDIARQKGGIAKSEKYSLQRFEVVRHV